MNFPRDMGRSYTWQIILLLGLTLVLAGCAPVSARLSALITRPGQGGNEQHVTLSEGNPVGQAFVANYAGLSGVQFFLIPEMTGSGEIIFHLRSDAQTSQDLATARMPLSDVDGSRFYRFDFPPIGASAQQYYYAFLEVQGPGGLAVGAADGKTYLNGALYQNHLPLEAQSAFNLEYNPWQMAIGLVTEVLGWGRYLLAAIFLCILPGWALLGLLWPGWTGLTWAEKAGLAAGVSLAIYPVLMVWAYWAGLRPGALYAWLPGLIAVGILVWRNLPPHFRRQKDAPAVSRTSKFRPSIALNLAVVGILALIVFNRFWIIRSLDAPMWGDSVQHTVITQLMLDQGGLFTSWEPYAPYDTLSNQFGFSALAALLAWIGGLSSTQAVLIGGQIAGILALLSIYPLAVQVTKNQWAGVGALLIAGLYSQTPAIYLNWGRYAQLAGQIVLPVAIWLTWRLLEEPAPERWRLSGGLMTRIGLGALTISGMLLNYYRMAHHYASFILPLLAVWGLVQWRGRIKTWGWQVGKLAGMALLAAFLLLPWLLQVGQGALPAAVESGVNANMAAVIEWVRFDYDAWQKLYDYVTPLFVGLAAVGLAWGLVRKQAAIICMGVWIGVMASLVAMTLLRVPGASMMQNFAVMVGLYIPMGVLAGWLLGELARMLKWETSPGVTTMLALVLLIAASRGAWEQRNLARPDSQTLVTRPDMRAMAWISTHTPAEARFLVEGFRIYDGLSATGADAGWWIPLLARRANTMPPQYALLNERPTQADYSQRVVQLIAGLEQAPLDSIEGIHLLCEWGINYVYVGQGQGLTSPGYPQLFARDVIERNPAYRLVYRQDRVAIFELPGAACGGQ